MKNKFRLWLTEILCKAWKIDFTAGKTLLLSALLLNCALTASVCAAPDKTKSKFDTTQGAVSTTSSSNTTQQAVAYENSEQQKLKQALAIDCASAHYNQGSQYLWQFKLDLAEVELDEAIASYPKYQIAHRDLVFTELFKGNFLRALAEWMMVVGLGEPIPMTAHEVADLNQTALKLHYNLGLQLAYQHKWTQALDEFTRALTYNRNNAHIIRSIAFAYASMGNFEAAERSYEQSFVLDPVDAFAHADFANVLSDHGDIRRASQQLNKAVELSPDATALHVDLGWMAEASCNWKTAADQFGMAVKLSPKHASLWEHLGKAFEKQGKLSEAEQAYAQALSINPQDTLAKDRLTVLKNLKGS